MIDPKTYYLYRHIRLDKNVPFYIGIGTRIEVNNQGYALRSDKARYSRAYSRQRSKSCLTVMDRHGYEVEILFETTDKNLIEEKEREFIKLYGCVYDGTGPLLNLTYGGVSFKPTPLLLEQHSKSCFKNGSQFNNFKNVYMYDLDGTFIEGFEAMMGPYQKYRIGDKGGRGIYQSIVEKTSFKDYYFSMDKCDKLDVYDRKPTSFNRNPIAQYDKNGHIVKVWMKTKEISDHFKIERSSVNRWLKSGELARGYYFKRIKPHMVKTI